MAKPDKLLPILEFDELIEIFEYPNRRQARRAMREGKFPVPTFELRGRTVAHVDVIDKFFDKKLDEGLKWLDEKYGSDDPLKD